jgi:DNA-binding XRE family transcriptional regulator
VSDSPSHTQTKEVTETLEKVHDLMSALRASLGMASIDITIRPNQLRALRKKARLTQSELGALIGARQSHISAIEQGKRYVGKEVKGRLAKALNCDIEDLGLGS